MNFKRLISTKGLFSKRNNILYVISFILYIIFFSFFYIPLISAFVLSVIFLSLTLYFQANKYKKSSLANFAISLTLVCFASLFEVSLFAYQKYFFDGVPVGSATTTGSAYLPGKLYLKPNETVEHFHSMPDLIRVGEKKFDGPDRFFKDSVSDTLYNDDREEYGLITLNTDSLGYRNKEDFNNHQYVLIGDSFTVGSMVTQDDNISDQLQEISKTPIYQAAVPTGPDGYLTIYNRLVEKVGTSSFKKIFLFYEGNDFFCGMEEVYGFMPSPEWHRISFFKTLNTYRFTYGAYQNTLKRLNPLRLVTEIKKIGDSHISFYTWYKRVTLRESCVHTPIWDAQITPLAKIKDAHFVFIPTKYRVYQHFFSDKSLPNIQSDYLKTLANKFNVPFIDLTNALIKESDRLIIKDEFVFWLYDTHWNPNGIKAAAKEINEIFIKNSNK